MIVKSLPRRGRNLRCFAKHIDMLEGKLSAEKSDRLAPSQVGLINIGVDVLVLEPGRIGAFGKVGAAFMNFTILIETKGSKGIGAWITLDGKRMEVLENDPEFPKYAILNTKITSSQQIA
jgi:hypothetical protein